MARIANLGVLPEARGRGLGGHRLRQAFGHYAALGRDRIGLGVDTGNSSGALALYERHGMKLDLAVDTSQLLLPVTRTPGKSGERQGTPRHPPSGSP
jgi:GNAT superfamily N-acetyltransferase